jgi:retron-type reverse transcriptase
MEYAERLVENGVPVIFDKLHLAQLFGMEPRELTKLTRYIKGQYHERVVPKKNGGKRILLVPSQRLKEIQQWILKEILYQIPISPFSKGFVRGVSILDNARIHEFQECIMHMDIQDFFSSISFDRVFRIFYYYGYTREVSYYLARLCTDGHVLPQGAPTSPYMANIVCLSLDKRLSSLAHKHGASYSRYADDISFSGDNELTKLAALVKFILNEEGFKTNDKKYRIQYQHQRQKVTGLVVNAKARVPRELERYLRQQIYYCNQYGVFEHLKKTCNQNRSGFKEHLYGLASFIKMVDNEKGLSYFNELNGIFWDY